MTQTTTHIATATGATIRNALSDEYEAVGRLTYAGFGHAEPGARQPAPERLELLLNAGARAASGDLLVAQDPCGRLVGTASLLRHGSALTRQSRPSGPHDGAGAVPDEDGGEDAGRYANGQFADGEAELRLLAVLPEARRLGVGRLLMEAALERAAAQGAPALVLDTGPGNFRSQRLYHSLGFDRVPTRETQPSTTGGKLAVFRYPFDEPGGVAVRLATRDVRGFDVWNVERRSGGYIGSGPGVAGSSGRGELLATVTTHPIAPPGSGAAGADVLAPIPHPVTFVPGAATADLRARIAEHLGILRHGGLVV